MVGLDSDSQAQNTQSSFNFRKGQEVEVSSDEEGFRGAWYMAKVVEAAPATKSASKKKKKVMVEYKTLVNEDGSTPLTELVDPAFVRPLPPDDNNNHNGHCVFKENDVVDAGYRDGWWTGVVRKVLQGSKYRVYFDNPPDVIDFDGKDLRPHWKWVNCNWVQPEKEQTTGSIFSSGTEVEVNIDEQNVRDAWFPAVVIKENEDKTFLVKYQSSGNNDEAGSKVNVDSLHIRPIPPRYADTNFELLERVDVQFDHCWRSGLITKLLAGRRYTIFFKHGNMEKEIDHAKIRPYAEWIDGKWICKCKGVMLVSDNQKQLSDVNSCDNSDMSLKLESSGAAEGKTEEKALCSTTIRDLLEQQTHCNESTSSNILPPSKKIKLVTTNGNGVSSCSSRKTTEENAVDVPLSVAASSLSKMPTETPTIETLRGLATRISGGKRTRFSKKPFMSDQVAAKTENTPAEKKEVDHHSNSVLIRIKELPEHGYLKSRQQKVAEVKSQKLDIVTRKGRHTKSPFRSPLVSEAVDSVTHINENEDENKEDKIPVVIALEAKAKGTQFYGEETLKLMKDQKNLNDSTGVKMMGFSQHRRGSSQRRKRGRPRKLTMSLAALDTGKEELGIQDVANEIVLKDQPINEVELPIQTKVQSTAVFTEGRAGASEADCLTKEVDMAVSTVSNPVVDDDQPLSTWIGGTHSSATAEELVLSSERPSNGLYETRARHADLAIVPSLNEAHGHITPDGNGWLPFEKRSLVWKTIESMEIFQIMPQKPHFRPLADCKEEYREGSAIGIMVTFASLFEKITSLQFDDSEGVLVSTLESLLDLEKHGFDVTMPRNRVKELLSIKDGKEELLNNSKDVEKQVREHTDEQEKLDAKIKDVEKKMIELQEELAASKSMVEMKKSAISRLQLHLDTVNKRISDARDSFEKIAAAPWKCPDAV